MSAHTFRWPLLLAVAAISLLTFRATELLAAAEDDDETMIMRAYPVYDLVLPVRNYPYPSQELPTVGEQGVPLDAGGFMGGTGGMGGGGMGGGMFAVPDQMRTGQPSGLAQFGGGTPESGSGGGMGGRGMGVRWISNPAGNPLQFSMDELINAVTSLVAPESWDNVGGPGRIQSLGGTLVVVNTESVHGEIEQLLESLRNLGCMHRSLVIEAYWLQITSDHLQALTGGQSAGKVDPAQLSQALTTPSLRFRGQITCLNGQTVYLVSGDRHTVITGAIPVVGSGAAYQPQHEIPNAGALLQTTAILLPGDKDVLLDLQSTVTEWGENTPRPLGDTEIDCPVIAAQQLATAVKIALGTPCLVGGLTVVGDEPAAGNVAPQESPQLYLVVQVTAADAAQN